MVHNDNKTVGFTSCHSRLFKLTGSVWIQASVCTVSACAHYATVRGHHRTEITPPPPSVLSQPNSLCLLAFSITCFPFSHIYTHPHTQNSAFSLSEVRKGSPLLTWSPGWQGRSCHQGHRSSWGVSCGSLPRHGCFHCCCCGRYAAEKTITYNFITSRNTGGQDF